MDIFSDIFIENKVCSPDIFYKKLKQHISRIDLIAIYNQKRIEVAPSFNTIAKESFESLIHTIIDAIFIYLFERYDCNNKLYLNIFSQVNQMIDHVATTIASVKIHEILCNVVEFYDAALPFDNDVFKRVINPFTMDLDDKISNFLKYDVQRFIMKQRFHDNVETFVPQWIKPFQLQDINRFNDIPTNTKITFHETIAVKKIRIKRRTSLFNTLLYTCHQEHLKKDKVASAEASDETSDEVKLKLEIEEIVSNIVTLEGRFADNWHIYDCSFNVAKEHFAPMNSAYNHIVTLLLRKVCENGKNIVNRKSQHDFLSKLVNIFHDVYELIDNIIFDMYYCNERCYLHISEMVIKTFHPNIVTAEPHIRSLAKLLAPLTTNVKIAERYAILSSYTIQKFIRDIRMLIRTSDKAPLLTFLIPSHVEDHVEDKQNTITNSEFSAENLHFFIDNYKNKKSKLCVETSSKEYNSFNAHKSGVEYYTHGISNPNSDLYKMSSDCLSRNTPMPFTEAVDVDVVGDTMYLGMTKFYKNLYDNADEANEMFTMSLFKNELVHGEYYSSHYLPCLEKELK